MTLDIERIEAELAAITQGEWSANGYFRHIEFEHREPHKVETGTVAICRARRQSDDTIFIAHSPSHVRALLARVKELEEIRRLSLMKAASIKNVLQGRD